MSNPEDNTDNQKLKELLNKNRQQEPLDEFEQDALEGFAMLENEKEALELKNKLDSKMYSEVFSEEKKSAKNYWYAAAGLFLVIGFSIYFFRNSEVIKKEDKLAIQTEHVMSADEIQKSIDAQTEKNQDLEFKSAGSTEPKLDSTKQSEQEVSVNSAPVEKPKVIGNALTAPAEYKPEPAAVAHAAPMADVAENKKTNEIAVASDKNISTDKEGDNDLKLKEEQSMKSSVSESKDDREVVTMEMKKSKAPERKKESSDHYYSTSPAPSSGAIAQPPTLFSIADENALQKELKENLKAKNLLEKFDASLLINQKGKVEQVIFTNAFGLTKSQQKEVSEIIRQLKTLTFRGNPKTVLCEYILIFRP